VPGRADVIGSGCVGTGIATSRQKVCTTMRAKRAPLRRLLVTSLVCFAACSNAPHNLKPESSTNTDHTASGDWLGFTPYPGARQLCNEFTRGFGGDHKEVEIHWVSFASRDANQQAIAFYSKTENGVVERKEGSLTLRRGDPVQDVLSIHAASSTDYPSCTNRPGTDERTIIEVSHVTRQ